MKQKNLFIVQRVNRSEKKEPRTEFYDIATGKPAFDVPFLAGSEARFTPDNKYLYQEQLGSFVVWNTAARKLNLIPLEVSGSSAVDPITQPSDGSSFNSEYVEFSPDFRYILRYGDDITAVFDTETGQRLQVIFDAAKVKYDKQNNIKNSGLGKAGWIKNGKYVYAFEEEKFFWGRLKAVNLWEVKK